MTYRPQFAFPPPPRGYEDEQFDYSFDGTNTPLLAIPILAGAFANNIILPMNADAPFFARALKIRTGLSHSTLSFQLKTPRGDYMQTVPVPIANFAGHIEGATIAGHYFIPFETEIEAPTGSNWFLYLYNPTTGTVNPPEVTLYGVKRRKCASWRAAA